MALQKTLKNEVLVGVATSVSHLAENLGCNTGGTGTLWQSRLRLCQNDISLLHPKEYHVSVNSCFDLMMNDDLCNYCADFSSASCS